MVERTNIETGVLASGLRRIRRRRWYLWVLILAYLPAMVLVLGSVSSLAVGGAAFAGWFILLSAASLAAALARCPRCGKRFHLQGMTLVPTRQCLHCQLPINADKRNRKRPAHISQ